VNANYEVEGKEEKKPMDMKGAVETAQRYLEREKSDRLAQVKQFVTTSHYVKYDSPTLFQN
jgi:hypothetical protein